MTSTIISDQFFTSSMPEPANEYPEIFRLSEDISLGQSARLISCSSSSSFVSVSEFFLLYFRRIQIFLYFGCRED